MTCLKTCTIYHKPRIKCRLCWMRISGAVAQWLKHRTLVLEVLGLNPHTDPMVGTVLRLNYICA